MCKSGCKRNSSCDFLHVILVQGDVNVSDVVEENAYKCAGCENAWTNRNCVVEHMLSNHIVYFCLNCEDWITDKSKVLDKTWSLFDKAGNLRHDV